MAVWGDSFSLPNAKDAKLAIPLDAADFLRIAEPTGALFAVLTQFFGDAAHGRVKAVYTRGGLFRSAWISTSAGLLQISPYVYVPHEAIVPALAAKDPFALIYVWRSSSDTEWSVAMKHDLTIDGCNRATGDKPLSPADAASWVIENVRKK